MANMIILGCSVALLLVLQISASQAADCTKYKIDINKLAVCKDVPNSILRPGTIKLKLTPDCKLYSSGCVEFGDFETASVSYWGKAVSPIPMNVSKSGIDGCAQMDNISMEAKAVMSAMNVPTECPVAAGKICSSNTKYVDLSNNTVDLDHALMIGGRFVGRVDTAFNDNKRGCIEFDIKICNAASKKSLPTMPKMPKFG